MPFSVSHVNLRSRLVAFAAAAGVLVAAGGSLGSSSAMDTGASPLHVSWLAAAAAGDRFSNAALNRAFQGMDPSMRAFAERYAPVPSPIPSLGSALPGAVGAQGSAGVAQEALQTLSPEAARLINASVPLSQESNPAARPFKLSMATDDGVRALQCLTEAVYYEAGFEPIEGRRAVAQVVLNRMRHPVYPKTVCGVVYQGSTLPTGCQFTFTCDGALGNTPVKGAWEQAREVAQAALDGYVEKSVGNATHYHANYVVPYWLPTLAKVAQIGTHIFYRWPGGMGLPAAFTGRYAGSEPNTKPGPTQQPEILLAVADKPQVVLEDDEPKAAPIQLAAAAVVAAPASVAITAPTSLKLEAAKTVPAQPRAVWVPPSPLSTGCGGAMGCTRGF